jgi:hypothetical protein
MKTYGEALNAIEIEKFLTYAIHQNDVLAQSGQHGAPICIWGTHGIGKTETIISFAEKHKYHYVYCAPAQFEEMGDLHGIPETYDPTPELPNSRDKFTIYRPPEWLKNAIENANMEEPGFLILDDFNRAEPRILQGCMQLLQMNALFSWSLPPRWQIILTANPEGGAYNVTEMDDAMLTRMIHLTMHFDAKSWAKWALENAIDTRGIDFILSHPTIVNGLRTTARSLTQFFQQIRGLKDLSNEDNLWLLRVLGRGTLDDETVNQFIHFITFVNQKIIQPEEILEVDDFKKIAKKLKSQVKAKGVKRSDLLSTICTRLQLHITSDHYKFSKKHKENVVAFLLNEDMEASFRFNIHKACVNAKNKASKKLVQDSALAKKVLSSL